MTVLWQGRKSLLNKIDFDNAAKGLRVRTLRGSHDEGEAHLGGSFSVIEVLLYLHTCFLKPQDCFILSKSHASFPFCYILQDLGYDVPLKTHLEFDPENLVMATTGSLGHGLPIAVGRSLGKKMRGEQSRVVVLISDGECQEGTTWESLMIAAHHQ